jgi:hypothetical protein
MTPERKPAIVICDGMCPAVNLQEYVSVFLICLFFLVCCSRCHTTLSRMTGGLKVLMEDEIWKNAETVWNELPSSKIASGFVQVSCIAKEVIKQNYDNSVLGMMQGRISTGIRRDFNETAKGVSSRKTTIRRSWGGLQPFKRRLQY